VGQHRLGVCHKPGTRCFDETKQGKYMTEADARKPGTAQEGIIYGRSREKRNETES
jgi:hypothetical protein